MFSLRNSLLFSAVKFFFQLVGIVLFRPVNLHNLFGIKHFSEFIIILLTHIQYLTTLGKTSFYLPLHLGIRQHRFRLRLHAFLFRSLPGGGVPAVHHSAFDHKVGGPIYVVNQNRKRKWYAIIDFYNPISDASDYLTKFLGIDADKMGASSFVVLNEKNA
mgnify:CR=1 FL=1